MGSRQSATIIEPTLKRRSFDGIRLDILAALLSGRTTVNDLSRRTTINWKTVDNHLIYLCGRGWAEKVFDSTSIKIFEITDEGKEHLERTQLRQSIMIAKRTNEKGTIKALARG